MIRNEAQSFLALELVCLVFDIHSSGYAVCNAGPRLAIFVWIERLRKKPSSWSQRNA